MNTRTANDDENYDDIPDRNKILQAPKVWYNGEPLLTRGDFGESIITGHVVDGYVYVWDSMFGWFLFSAFDPDLWSPTHHE